MDATSGDGTRHRAVLEFSSAAEEATGDLEVRTAAGLSRRSVDRLFDRYVREAVLREVDTPVVGTLVALLVAEIAERAWTELGAREATWGTLSAAVSYRSRSPSGAPATLSGLVAMPDVVGAPDYVAPDRIVVLTHATGSTPSRLSPADGSVVLANLLAGRGYLVVAPDNWGRGHGDGADEPETYLMANRVAANGLDMVRAVLEDTRYAVFHDAGDTVDVAVLGYSQGAHSAVALWLASASGADGVAVREVYAGGGPHDLYRSVRGALEGIADRCDGNPWCRSVDRDVIVPYAVGRILPAYLQYTDVGLAVDDFRDGEGLSEAFVTGMLDGEERFDALRTMLQLNSFPNLSDPARALPATDARIHLYHSPFDRLLPQRNTADLAEALLPGFDVTADLEACSSPTFEELGELVDMAGVVHAICAFEVFDDVFRELRQGEAARTGYDRAAGRALDAAAPWRDLAEHRAGMALADTSGLAAFRAETSRARLRTLARRIRCGRETRPPCGNWPTGSCAHGPDAASPLPAFATRLQLRLQPLDLRAFRFHPALFLGAVGLPARLLGLECASLRSRALAGFGEGRVLALQLLAQPFRLFTLALEPLLLARRHLEFREPSHQRLRRIGRHDRLFLERHRVVEVPAPERPVARPRVPGIGDAAPGDVEQGPVEPRDRRRGRPEQGRLCRAHVGEKLEVPLLRRQLQMGVPARVLDHVGQHVERLRSRRRGEFQARVLEGLDQEGVHDGCAPAGRGQEVEPRRQRVAPRTETVHFGPAPGRGSVRPGVAVRASAGRVRPRRPSGALRPGLAQPLQEHPRLRRLPREDVRAQLAPRRQPLGDSAQQAGRETPVLRVQGFAEVEQRHRPAGQIGHVARAQVGVEPGRAARQDHERPNDTRHQQEGDDEARERPAARTVLSGSGACHLRCLFV